MTLSFKETAKHFFTEMAEWERWCSSMDRTEENFSIRLKKLKIIFEKYLSRKALDKGQSRYEMLMFGKPPEYELQITNVEKVSAKKYFVHAKGDGWEPEKRYVFVKEDEEWRVEYREYEGSANKWVKESEL